MQHHPGQRHTEAAELAVGLQQRLGNSGESDILAKQLLYRVLRLGGGLLPKCHNGRGKRERNGTHHALSDYLAGGVKRTANFWRQLRHAATCERLASRIS